MEINLTAPRCWKELSPRQLVYISWLMCRGTLTVQEFHALAFVRLCGITVLKRVGGVWHCRRGKDRFTLTAEQALSFSKRFSWLTSEPGEVIPLPRLCGTGHRDARLHGLPFSHYLACENYYQAWLFTKREDFLNCLIASFYLGDEKFDDEKTAALAERFAGLPFHVRHTVFLWFYGLKSVFRRHFPHFFQRVETILEEEPRAPDMRGQMNGMIRALTGGDVTKTDAVAATDTWTALAELDAKARENKELERRMKKIK